MGVKGWQELSLSANEEHLDQVAVQIHVLNWIATIAEEMLYQEEWNCSTADLSSIQKET